MAVTKGPTPPKVFRKRFWMWTIHYFDIYDFYKVSEWRKTSKQKTILTVFEIQYFCVLFQLHLGFSLTQTQM